MPFIIKIYIFLFVSALSAQNNWKNLTDTFVADTYFGKDNYNYLYFKKNNELFKKNQDTTYYYKNVLLSEIYSIDFKNPLQTVVFYKKHNAVVLLDNFFNEINTLYFNLIADKPEITYASLSQKNKIWVYNAIYKRFGLYNLLKEDIEYIGNTLNFECNIIGSTYNYLYFFNDKNQLHRISIYGFIEKIIDHVDYHSIQIINDNLAITLYENNFYLIDFSDKKTQNIFTVENSFSNFYYQNRNLTIFTNNKIKQININQP